MDTANNSLTNMPRPTKKLEELTIEEKKFILMAAEADGAECDYRDFVIHVIENGYTGYSGMPDSAIEEDFRGLCGDQDREQIVQFLNSFPPWNNEDPIIV
jgi:hypothetical protein